MVRAELQVSKYTLLLSHINYKTKAIYYRQHCHCGLSEPPKTQGLCWYPKL